MSKTLLLLGGARYALPVIDAAHELGAKVVTCDYLPHNYAHTFSDQYINASIVDNEAVLAAAQQEASPWGVLSVLLIFLVGAVLYFGVLPRMLKKEGAEK